MRRGCLRRCPPGRRETSLLELLGLTDQADSDCASSGFPGQVLLVLGLVRSRWDNYVLLAGICSEGGDELGEQTRATGEIAITPVSAFTAPIPERM